MNQSKSTPAVQERRPVPRYLPRAGLPRLLGAAAAALCASATIAFALTPFHRASSDPVLQPTPALLADRAQCDRLPERGAGGRCARGVVEQARTRDAATGRFAQR